MKILILDKHQRVRDLPPGTEEHTDVLLTETTDGRYRAVKNRIGPIGRMVSRWVIEALREQLENPKSDVEMAAKP